MFTLDKKLLFHNSKIISDIYENVSKNGSWKGLDNLWTTSRGLI